MDFFSTVHANYISARTLGNVALINCSIIPDNHAMKRRNIYLPTWHLKFCRFQRSKDTICIFCIPIYSDQESKNRVFIMPFHSSVYSMVRSQIFHVPVERARSINMPLVQCANLWLFSHSNANNTMLLRST